MNKFYKVVRINGSGNLVSCRAYDNQVSYKENEWISGPRGTLLFVFSSLEEAKRFKRLEEQIWECEVQDYIEFRGVMYSNDIDLFWETLINNNYVTSSVIGLFELSDIPAILTKSVKLLKKID